MGTALGDVLQVIHRRGKPNEMNREDGARARRDQAFHIFRIKVERLWIDVTGDQLSPLADDGVGRGDEIDGRADDLVARLQVEAHHRHVQSRSGAVDGDGVLGPGVLGE